MDLTKITDIHFEDIDFKDYPDFSDAYISSAKYDNREMTDEEIQSLPDDFVNEKLWEFII